MQKVSRGAAGSFVFPKPRSGMRRLTHGANAQGEKNRLELRSRQPNKFPREPGWLHANINKREVHLASLAGGSPDGWREPGHAGPKTNQAPRFSLSRLLAIWFKNHLDPFNLEGKCKSVEARWGCA
ncbi:hypothetical protein SEVIR_5G292501v4 [Setaria viridis]